MAQATPRERTLLKHWRSPRQPHLMMQMLIVAEVVYWQLLTRTRLVKTPVG